MTDLDQNMPVSEQDNLSDLSLQLKAIQKGFTFKKEREIAKTTAFIRDHLPLAAKLGGSATSTAKTISNLASANSPIGKGFGWASFAFSMFDFIRIPALYLSSWINGEKDQITASRNIRFTYASVLMGLSIAALADPVAAVPIAIATSALGMAASIVTFTRFFTRRAKYTKEIKEINLQLDEKNKVLEDIQKHAKQKEAELQAALAVGDKLTIAKLEEEIPALHKNYKETCTHLQALTARRQVVEVKIKKYGSARLLDKSVGVGLASLALAGVTLSLFFPPLGGILVASATIAGFAYLTGRVLAPYLTSFFNWIGNKFKSSTPKEEIADSPKDDLSYKVGPKEAMAQKKQDGLQNKDYLDHESEAEILSDLNPEIKPLLNEAPTDIHAIHLVETDSESEIEEKSPRGSPSPTLFKKASFQKGTPKDPELDEENDDDATVTHK